MATTIKCVLVGDGNVGKTSLLIRYTTKEFPTIYEPTVFENYAATETVGGKSITLHLFDTAGQEGYAQLRTFSYVNASVFVVCFAVDSRNSFDNVRDKWVPEIRNHSKSPIVLVGTKVDLRDDETTKTPIITKPEGNKLRMEIKGAAYVECSAKERINIENVFQEALLVASSKPKKSKCSPFLGFCRIFRCNSRE